MIKRLYSGIIALSLHPRAVYWLALIAFIESSVFPIPPDLLLIPMILSHTTKAWRYALIATLASVAGGWLGYAIGYSLYETIGGKIIAFYHLEASFAIFKEKCNIYGPWIILLKGMTPIPFKLITIASGAVHLDPLLFTLSSLGARAIRFFLVATLLKFYGEQIRDFIEKRLILVTTIASLLVVGGFLILKLL